MSTLEAWLNSSAFWGVFAVLVVLSITMFSFGFYGTRRRQPLSKHVPGATSIADVVQGSPLTFEMLAGWRTHDRRDFHNCSAREILNIPHAQQVSGFSATLPQAYIPVNVIYASVIGTSVLALSLDKLHLVLFQRYLNGRYQLKYVSCGSQDSLEEAFYILRAQLHEEYLAFNANTARRVH